MTNIESWKIWALFGGIPIVTSAIISAIWFLVSKRIILKWSYEQNEKIEAFKNELNKSSSLLTNLLNSQTNTYLLAQEKRLMAVESIWNAVLRIKNEFPPQVNLMYSILTEVEIRNILNDFDPKRTLPSEIRKFNLEAYTNKLVTEFLYLDQFRIYLDTKIWTAFFVYRAFCGRVAYWVGKGIKDGQILPWQEDNAIKEILKILFKQDVLDQLLSPKTSFQYCLDTIEYSVLNEITGLTTGEKFSELYVKEFIKWNSKLKE